MTEEAQLHFERAAGKNQLEYRVIVINKAGEGQPSNIEMIVL